MDTFKYLVNIKNIWDMDFLSSLSRPGYINKYTHPNNYPGTQRSGQKPWNQIQLTSCPHLSTIQFCDLGQDTDSISYVVSSFDKMKLKCSIHFNATMTKLRSLPNARIVLWCLTLVPPHAGYFCV